MKRLLQASLTAVLVLLSAACPGRKQVPFGLDDSGTGATGGVGLVEAVPGDLREGQTYEPGRVEVSLGETTMVVPEGYALASLGIGLDDDEELDVIVVASAPEKVQLLVGYPRGLTVDARAIEAFLVPDDCVDPTARIRTLSESLIVVEVQHRCDAGLRTNHWIVSVEAQPRVRERLTVLPPAPSDPEVALAIEVEDRDTDGYDDVVATTQVGPLTIPLTWLNRPGGFSRDTSQPEATFRELADQAAAALDTDPAEAQRLARAVLDGYRALCREGGSARVGVSGTHGIQCGGSPGTARAFAVAAAAALRRGDFVQALELQRAWEHPSTNPAPADRQLVRDAWRRAQATRRAEWQLVDRESRPSPLYFADSDNLVIGGRQPRTVNLSSGQRSNLVVGDALPPIRDPDNRFRVADVRVTCAGYEAEVGPIRGARTHRVSIERSPPGAPCKAAIDRSASALEWAVLGWAPQGLVAASDDRIRIIPLDARGRPAGRPIDLTPGSPLPAPIRGARITPDGTRYVIPHAEGIVIRDWKTRSTGLWLRPAGWEAVPGQVTSLAISPDGRRVAVQKGTDIRVVSW